MELQTLQHPRFGSVRFGEIDGVKYYVGRDVGTALGYGKPESFVVKHVDEADRRKVPVRTKKFNTANTILVNSRGVSAMCAAASSVDAEAIKTWLLGSQPIKDMANVPQLLNLPEFGKMRWISIDNDIWFVVADLCKILDLQNPTMVVAALDDDEKKKVNENGVTVDPKLNSGQLSFNSAFMLYRLITMSRKPEAKKFQRVIYHEILPSIRKTGSYSTKTADIKEKNRMRKQFATAERFELAVVYVLLLSNATVKIGYTKDLTERIKKIEAETDLFVLNYKSTPFMSVEDARELEAKLKEMFAADCIGGEYFDVKFSIVCAEI